MPVVRKELLEIATLLMAADIGSRSVYHYPSDAVMVKMAIERACLLIDATDKNIKDN